MSKARHHHGVAPKDIHPKPHHEKHGVIWHGRKDGGRLEGKHDAEEDLEEEPETHEKEERDEEAVANERKRGGRAKKHVGKIGGEKHRCHGGRAPRKSGGRAEASPFSAAHSGTPAPGRKLERETMD